MEVKVQAQGLSDAPFLRQHVRQRMQTALGRFTESVHLVTVRLGDINGPKGGTDKLCRVVVHLKNRSQVVIEELGDDLLKVVNKVTDRLHQSVSRQIGRIKRAGRGQHRTFDEPALTMALA